MYLLGSVTSRLPDLSVIWRNSSDVEYLQTHGRVKSHLFQSFTNPYLFTFLSEWISENHYLDYVKSTEFQTILKKYKLDFKPDRQKLRLINHWLKTKNDKEYCTLINFTSSSKIDFIQSQLDMVMYENETKLDGVNEVFFFTGFKTPSVYTLLLSWDSLQSLESWKVRLSNNLHEFSFLKLDYTHIYLLKLV